MTFWVATGLQIVAFTMAIACPSRTAAAVAEAGEATVQKFRHSR